MKPTSTLTVKFDASFARADNGETDGLKYYWDFGDGTTRRGMKVSHTYTSSTWADVKLVVAQGGDTTSGHVPAGGRGEQPVGPRPVDSRLRDVLRDRARRAPRRRAGGLKGKS